MVAEAYFRLATALANSAVFVMAGGAYAEPATIVLKNEVRQDGDGRKRAGHAVTAEDRNRQGSNSSGASKTIE